MNSAQAFLGGLRRVQSAKRYLFLVYLINLAVAIALGAVLSNSIRASLGSSTAGQNLRQGFDDFWYQTFSSSASGVAATFHPTVVGIGAVFNGLNSFIQGNLFDGYVGIVAVGLLYLLMWTFFSAGFISVYKNPGGERSFFAQSARFFPRFVILAILAGILYYLIFHFVMGWLDSGVESLTRNVIDERIAFLYTLIEFAVLWALVFAVQMVFDYGKILTVVRDHRNALTAPIKGLGFVLSNLGKTVGVFVAVGLVWVAFVLVYWLVVPGAGQASWLPILLVFLLGQLYILSRIWTKCLFYGSETALYQGVTSSPEAAT